MNYRHAFHAGNFADVVKHVALVLLLLSLQRKDKPYCYVDTHAGAGIYDLESEAAARTGEFKGGIERIWGLQDSGMPGIGEYLNLIARLNGDPRRGRPPRYYPGSPWIARALARPQDRMELWERHPDETRVLLEHMGDQSGVALHGGDGHQSVRAALPPRERRGLVFIDPPYESGEEWELVLDYLGRAYRRWRNGIYAVWYPIKEESAVAHLHKRLQAGSIRNVLAAEVRTTPAGHPMGLYGSGLILVNPPWQFDTMFARSQAALAKLLAPRFGTCRVDWLVPE